MFDPTKRFHDSFVISSFIAKIQKTIPLERYVFPAAMEVFCTWMKQLSPHSPTVLSQLGLLDGEKICVRRYLSLPVSCGSPPARYIHIFFFPATCWIHSILAMNRMKVTVQHKIQDARRHSTANVSTVAKQQNYILM